MKECQYLHHPACLGHTSCLWISNTFMSLTATKNNFSKSGNIGAHLGIVTKIPRAESVALVDTERRGLQICQDPAWLLDNAATLLLSAGAGAVLSAAH